MQQLFLNTPFSSCISLDFLCKSDHISDLRSFLSSKYQIPPSSLVFSNDSRVLSNDTLLCSLSGFLHANFSLSGGKGGFGSLLRGQAATKRKTTNFDASKDLKGRRIRNVENEKKIKEFLLKKQEEDIKVEKKLKEYKKLEQKRNINHFEAKLTQEYKNKLEDWENKMGESIAVGRNKLKVNEDANKTLYGFEIPKKKICFKIDNETRNLYDKMEEIEKEKTVFPEQNVIQTEDIIEKEIIPEKINIKYPEIDLNNISSIEDLEILGSEPLKQELMKLGLKCGGNLRERAQRLFDIKKDPKNLFNPKYLAKIKK